METQTYAAGTGSISCYSQSSNPAVNAILTAMFAVDTQSRNISGMQNAQEAVAQSGINLSGIKLGGGAQR